MDKSNGIKIKKILINLIFYSILVIFITISFITIKAKINGVQPEFLGYRFYIVLTGSMNPKIKENDLIIVKDTDYNKIKINDVITFKTSTNENILVTHRVTNIKTVNEELQFTTKGDANNTEDTKPVLKENIQGKVMKSIPKIGIIINFIKENITLLIISLIAILTLIYTSKFIIKKKYKVIKFDNK